MREITDDKEIHAFLAHDAHLHLYEIGDLGAFFRPHSRYFATPDSGPIESLFLIYDNGTLPVLIALEQSKPAAAERLLAELLPHLPDRFYAHLSPSLAPMITSRFRFEIRGRHLRMALRDRGSRGITLGPGQEVRPLTSSDLARLTKFYAAAYPGNWFDARMLETGKFLGGFAGKDLAAVAGIHVFSPEYLVAALGNIAVAERFRGRGWGRTVTHFLCASMPEIRHLGLNVHEENTAAIRTYESLGFATHAAFHEFLVWR